MCRRSGRVSAGRVFRLEGRGADDGAKGGRGEAERQDGGMTVDRDLDPTSTSTSTATSTSTSTSTATSTAIATGLSRPCVLSVAPP